MSELKQRLIKLANLESTYPHILSCYFRVRDGANSRVKECLIALKNRVAEIENVLSGDTRARQFLKREVEVASRLLEQDIPQGVTGMAFFIRAGEVIERFDTAFAFDNQIAYRRVPHIAQLAFMDEELEPFMVVALDSRNARIFDVALGVNGGTAAAVKSDVHGRIHAGGWSQMRFQRHIDNQKREHLEDVVHHINALVKKLNYKRIMLAGPEKTTSQLAEMLPPAVRKRVIERTTLDARHTTEKEIVDGALKYFAEAETAEENEKIRRVRVEIHSTRMAIAGLDGVIHALQHGQVHELLLAHDINEKGVECTECGAIYHGSGVRTGKCPACDAPHEKLKDIELREWFTRKALTYGVKLEFIKVADFKATLGPAAAMLRSPFA